MRSDVILPIILAGGYGTRLWPLSRKDQPKQFLTLFGKLSLFQNTLMRVADRTAYAAPIIVANHAHRHLVEEQARACGIEIGALILEPEARGTGPAVIAAACVAQEMAQSMMLVMPADHHIVRDRHYDRALTTASQAAYDGFIATFGIKPSHAATGFGYIQTQSASEHETAIPIHRFIEKPNKARAGELIGEASTFWNSGMVLARPQTLIKQAMAHCPDLYQSVSESVASAQRRGNAISLEDDAFARAPCVSIDCAILEKTDRACVVPSKFHWSDVGTWDRVFTEAPCDTQGNFSRGSVTLHNTTNSIVISDGPHLSINGLSDASVIATDDAVYVGAISSAEDIGALIQSIAESKSSSETMLLQQHKLVPRPWGSYRQIAMDERFQVKRLLVQPGMKLSLQKHLHRSEHWVVVKGTAEVTLDDNTFVLRENQSTYVPQDTVHRVANPGKIPLEIIEIQIGSYLGEDDIIRFEDDFGRIEKRQELSSVPSLALA